MSEPNDPIHGIDNGPCDDFAPDTLGDDPNVCTSCFYHRIDHAMDAGGIGHPLTLSDKVEAGLTEPYVPDYMQEES